MESEILVYPSGKYAGQPVNVDMSYLDWVLKSRDSEYLSSYKWQDFLDDHFDDLRKVRVAGVTVTELDIQLTDSQGIAAKFVDDELGGGESAGLFGGAGYGKSYVMKRVVQDALDKGVLPALMAPSRVASDNLAEGLSEFDGLRIGTIAALLGLNKVYDGESVDYVWCDESEVALQGLLGEGRMLVCDEMPMVGDEIGENLIRGANEYGGRLLVVGDEKQLQPVGQETRSVLCDVEPYSRLITPMRYPVTSDLYAVEQMARENPFDVDWGQFAGSNSVHGGSVFEMVRRVREMPDDVTVSLHYFTANVVRMNQRVRHGLFGNSPCLVEEAEHLRIVNTGDYACEGRLHDGTQWLEDGLEDSVRVYSGKMIQVKRLHTGWHLNVEETGDVLPVVRADVVIGGMEMTVNLLFAKNDTRVDESVGASAAFGQVLGRLRQWAKAEPSRWGRFHKFRDSFVWCQYPYAMSIHRAQGMTADNVFFALGELAGMDAGLSRDGLAYVAMTRARKSLNMIWG